MNQDWNTSGWGLLRRIIWLALVVGLLIAGLRLMAWADEGARNLPVTTPAGVNGSF